MTDFERFFPYLFPAFWCVITYLLAWFGGWLKMSRKWAAPSNLSLEKRYFRSGRLGKTKYNGALVTAATREGLYLSVLLPFRVGHKPLLVPWEELKLEGPDTGFLTHNLIVLSTSQGNKIKLFKTELQDLLGLASRLGADVKHLSDS